MNKHWSNNNVYVFNKTGQKSQNPGSRLYGHMVYHQDGLPVTDLNKFCTYHFITFISEMRE